VLNKNNCTFIIIATFFMALGAACAQVKDLIPLRQELINQFHQENLELTVQNGKILNITFINSEFNALEQSQKKEKAREIAAFAKSHYASIGGIEDIGITFIQSKEYIVASTSSAENYVFKKDELN
jgi:predicted PilT family ATPase